MIRFFILLLLSFSAVAAPAPVVPESFTFQFDSVRLTDLVRVVFSDVLKVSYVVDTDLLNDKNSIGFSVHGVTKAEVKSTLVNVLDRHGFTVTDSKIIHIKKKGEVKTPDPDEMELFFYRPKYRSVSYITDLVSTLFEKGHFSSSRKIKRQNSPAQNPLMPVQPAGAMHQPNQNGNMQSPVQNVPIDSGQSAFSMMDKEQDSFIFEGSAKEINKLQNLLVHLDSPVGQVFVRGHVFEVTTGAKEASAFALAIKLLSAGSPLNGNEWSKWLYKLGDVTKSLPNAVSVSNSTIDAVYSALSTDSRFKLVSSPALRAVSGEKARFSVGSDVPVLGSVHFDQNGNPIQSVEYKPSGVILDIKPIVRDSSIELNVNQTLSSFIQTTTGVNNSPTLIKRELQSNIVVSDGDVVMLGGLDESRTSSDSAGFPYLPHFLRSNGSDDSKTELLLVLETNRI